MKPSFVQSTPTPAVARNSSGNTPAGQAATAAGIAQATAAGRSSNGTLPGNLDPRFNQPVQGGLIGSALASAPDIRSLTYQTIRVPSLQSIQVSQKGDYIYVEGVAAVSQTATPTETPVIMTPDTLGTPIPVSEAYRSFQFPRAFNTIQLYNPNSGTDIFVTLWVGYGEIRRDRGARTGWAYYNTTVTNFGAMLAGDAYVEGPFQFLYQVPVFTNRVTINRAVLRKGSTVTTNADFTLYLYGGDPGTPAVSNSPFVLPSGAAAYQRIYLGQIRFASWLTLGAGNTDQICDVANLQLSSMNINRATDKTIYGYLVCNAAYTAALDETVYVDLDLEFD